MERCEKYKDSGVEWIGEIPEGWEVKSFRYNASNFGNGTTDNCVMGSGQANWLELFKNNRKNTLI